MSKTASKAESFPKNQGQRYSTSNTTSRRIAAIGQTEAFQD